MTPFQIIQLLATLVGAVSDITTVMTEIHAQGTSPNMLVAPEHVARIKAALSTVPTDAEWDANHQSS